MPVDGVRSNKGLIAAAGAATGAVVAGEVRQRRLRKIAAQEKAFRSSSAGMEEERLRMAPSRRGLLPEDTSLGAKKRAWSEARLNENPDEFRKATKARRLADRAARASKLAKGLTKKMGVLGATAGMADTLGAASRADNEGGSFEARFGKFAEEWLGLQPGATQRPLTDKEKKDQWST